LASSTAKTNKSFTYVKMRVRHLLAGALLLGSVVGSVATAQSIADEQRALAQAKAQSAAAEERAARIESRASAETSKAEAARDRAAAVAARIQSAEADIAAAEVRIRLIEKLRSDQRARLAAKQEPAIHLISALQMMARRPPALALVQPGSVNDLVHVRAVLATMVPILKQRTAGVRAELENSRRLRAAADQAVAAMSAGQKRLESQRLALAQLSAEHRLASQKLSGSAIVEQDRAIALGEKARDIAELVTEIGASAQVSQALASLPGPILRPQRPGDARAAPSTAETGPSNRLPYRIPVAGRVVAGLGEVSSAGVRARGLTLATRSGAQVIAPNDGRIVYAAPFRGYGLIVIIDHGAGWTTLITSLAALDVAVGDSVVQGSPIGRSGIDHPMVTVELRRGSRPIDITHLVG
jgi:murein hydrolase activator